MCAHGVQKSVYCLPTLVIEMPEYFELLCNVQTRRNITQYVSCVYIWVAKECLLFNPFVIEMPIPLYVFHLYAMCQTYKIWCYMCVPMGCKTCLLFSPYMIKMPICFQLYSMFKTGKIWCYILLLLNQVWAWNARILSSCIQFIKHYVTCVYTPYCTT